MIQKWTCKHDCGYSYESPVKLSAQAHNCPKRKGRNIDSVLVKELSDSPCKPEKKQVASSRSTNAPISREDNNMATKRAEPKATKADKAAKPKATEATADKKGRRSFGNRGWLAVKVDKFLRKPKNIDQTVPVGTIVKNVTNSEGEHPSTGAVAACIQRWGDQGYCKVKTTRPLSFNGYAAKWKDSNLDDFLDVQKEKRAKARASTKA